MTAADYADCDAAEARAASEEQERARVRDIPRQCDGWCLWVWSNQEHRWVLRKLKPGCPRHWAAS